MQFSTSAPSVVVSHDRRMANGLVHWVDGSMGFVRAVGSTQVIAPNGARMSRHRFDEEDDGGGLAALPVAVDDAIVGERQPSDHASGGPVFVDPAGDQLLLFYHGETFTDGDPADFYAFIGIAVSDDDGATFEDLGRVITPAVPEGDPGRLRPLDVGPGAFVVRDGWFHLYFFERGIGVVRRLLSVARAPVVDVLRAARERRTPTFHKYLDGSWTEPGIGGDSTDLLRGQTEWVAWFDVSFVEWLDAALLVYSTGELVDGRAHWMHMASLSADGIRWTEPSPLLPTATTDEILYLTIDSGTRDQRTIIGSSFDLYRTRARAPYRWDDACIEVQTVRLSVP